MPNSTTAIIQTPHPREYDRILQASESQAVLPLISKIQALLLIAVFVLQKDDSSYSNAINGWVSDRLEPLTKGRDKKRELNLGQTVGALERLVELGLIIKGTLVPNPTGGRKVIPYTITPLGRAVLQLSVDFSKARQLGVPARVQQAPKQASKRRLRSHRPVT